MYQFGIGKRRLTRAQAKQLDAIADRHDASFYESTIPRTGYQWWFATENLGSPFNEQTARAVMAEVNALLGEAE